MLGFALIEMTGLLEVTRFNFSNIWSFMTVLSSNEDLLSRCNISLSHQGHSRDA